MVRLRSRASLERHALLAARERLVRIQRDLLNQIRGLAKPLGWCCRAPGQAACALRSWALRLQERLGGKKGAHRREKRLDNPTQLAVLETAP